MTEPKRFILVGLGGWGAYWLRQVLPRLCSAGLTAPAACVDIDPGTFPDACRLPGVSEQMCYTDAEKAFRENPADFAIIVVPPRWHERYVDLTLEHGLDILCEKPIADTMEGCARVFRKVSSAGRKMMVTMSHRFDQDKQTLERAIRSGRYGELDYLIGRNTWMCRAYGTWGAFRYEMPDPLLIEGTVHHFDIMRSLAGSNARTVYASTWNPCWSEFKGDAQALVTVVMENGVRVFYEGAKNNASSLNGWTSDYWRAECRDGTLVLDRRRLTAVTGTVGVDSVTTEIPLERQEVWMNPWLAEMFVGWLNGGPEPPCTLEDNIQCCALMFAAVKSAHTGQAVDVQEFLRESLEAAG